ncbi:hypothetical protein ABIC83_002819 [Roseateles asaccharophilus]|uniref:hypothetical protein n=1 Tax=Roseateles asaccharophilus TaxID=582607 RepID=UPI003837B11E
MLRILRTVALSMIPTAAYSLGGGAGMALVLLGAFLVSFLPMVAGNICENLQSFCALLDAPDLSPKACLATFRAIVLVLAVLSCWLSWNQAWSQ